MQFRTSKRGLHWLTLTNDHGVGLALLPTEVPLIRRANPTADSTVLFASRELTADHPFSGPWVVDHNIRASKGKLLAGLLVLRVVDAPTLTAVVSR